MVVSHVLVGLGAWVVAARLGGTAPDALPGLAAAAAGALLPDIDHPSSWLGRRVWVVSKPLSRLIGHRGLTHSLLAVAGGLMLLDALRPGRMLAGLVEPLAVGYLSHLAMDALTPAGVPLLWPWRQRFGVALCSSGGAMEMLVVAAILAAAGWFVWR